MNFGPLLFLALLATLSLSWLGMVVTPFFQMGNQQEVIVQPAGYRYPTGRPGLAQQGLEVYRANGCYQCHTRQVLPDSLGADIKRGWGTRITVAQDFLLDQPVLLGDLRAGPDLANIGTRQPDANWHLLHLYNPRITSPGSTMPAYPYLFEKRKKGAYPAPNALKIPDAFAEKDFEVIPTAEAYALVAFLQNQQVTAPLFEAPLPQKPKTDDGSTNQPPADAAATNQAAGTPSQQQ